MGTKPSSLADESASNKVMEETEKLEHKSSGERGLNETPNHKVIEELVEVGIETDSEFEISDDESDDEDEDYEERLRILDDAKELKALAVAYLHPELPVKSDPTASARCYFSRPSAPEQESVEEAEYRQQVLADAAALKQLAVDYAHPELPVKSDPTASARCYFSRPSAPEQESVEEAEYRQQVLADAAALKQLAVDYAHPEIGVVTSDPTASARCYFSRPSAPEQETIEEAEYRQQVLADAAALKQLAVDYAHPEHPVKSDPTASARCYFSRPSAPEQETIEEAEYRQQVLADAAALKQLAVDYAHPEIGVVTSDPTASARCYFSRPSAPEQVTAKVQPMKISPSQSTKTIIVPKDKVSAHNKNPTSVKKLDTLKSTDIVRSLSSVQLFGLDGEGDASY